MTVCYRDEEMGKVESIRDIFSIDRVLIDRTISGKKFWCLDCYDTVGTIHRIKFDDFICIVADDNYVYEDSE